MLIELIFTLVLGWTILKTLMAWINGTTNNSDQSMTNNYSHPSMSMPLPQSSSTLQFSSQSDENEFISSLLSRARDSLSSEKPMEALGLVLAAARQQGGEVRVFDVLNEARRDYGLQPHSNPLESQRHLQSNHNNNQHQRATVELIEDSEDEAMVDDDNNNSPHGAFSMNSIHHSLNEANLHHSETSSLSSQSNTSVLESRGDGNLISDALSNGDYGSCPHCGAVVARNRLEQHSRYWCSAINDED